MKTNKHMSKQKKAKAGNKGFIATHRAMGATYKEIAAAIGTTWQYVQQVCKREGVEKGRVRVPLQHRK